MVSAVFFAAAGIVAIAQIAFEIHARITAKKNKGLEFNEVLVLDKRIAVENGEVHYYITFRRKDGIEREFEVDSIHYSQIEEGEEGELCLEYETFTGGTTAD